MKTKLKFLWWILPAALTVASCQNSTVDNHSLQYESLDVNFAAKVTGPEWTKGMEAGVIALCTRDGVEETLMSSVSTARFESLSAGTIFNMVSCTEEDKVISYAGDHNYRFYAFAPYSQVSDLSAIPADVPSVVEFGSAPGGLYAASNVATSVIAPVNLDFVYTACVMNISVPYNVLSDEGSVLKKMVVRPADPAAFNGALSGPATYDIYQSKTTLAASGLSQEVTVDFGSEGYALPKGRTVVSFAVLPFTVPANGLEVELTGVDNNTVTIGILKSAIGNSFVAGDSISQTISVAGSVAVEGCTSPVEWPIGNKRGVEAYPSDKRKEWTVATGYSSDKSYIWYSTQKQATMTFSVGDDTKYIQYFKSEYTSSSPNNYYAPGIKGMWTGYYFEFSVPVVNFAANTEVTLSVPTYTRGAPLFWNVEYLDGVTWKCNTTKQKSPDGQYEKDCTWVIPHGNTHGNFEGNFLTHTMKFENSIKEGYMRIRLVCADGTLCASNESGKTLTDNTTQVRSGLGSGYDKNIFSFVNKSDKYQSVKIEW